MLRIALEIHLLKAPRAEWNARLIRILMRCKEGPHFMRWVNETHDWIEEFADEKPTIEFMRETFKNQLLCRCAELLDLMPASEKFKNDFQEFMTAAELDQQTKRTTMLRNVLESHLLKARRAEWIWRQPPRPNLVLVYKEPCFY